jgi:1-acyl-sn-glycerol-3-phosphate acyltransferase
VITVKRLNFTSDGREFVVVRKAGTVSDLCSQGNSQVNYLVPLLLLVDPHLWPMQGKTGAVRIALESGCPLFPMVQWGSQNVIGPYKKQFRLLPRKTMCVWLGEPMDLSRYRDKEWTPELLHEATDQLMLTIARMEGEIRGEAPPAVLYRHTVNQRSER